MTKNFFEKYATPISIIVAGLLVGVGIIVAKVVEHKSANTAVNAPQTTEDVVADISNLPIVKKLGIKSKDLAACINAKETVERVESDTALGAAAGLRGTPHMIVMTKHNGKDVQFQLFGALEKDMIEKAIAEGATPAEEQSYVSKFDTQVLSPTDHIQGDPATASATIIEYSDIDCPFCKKLQPTMQELVDEGKIAWVFRHSPIPQLHPNAKTKAIAVECAVKLGGEQAFWKYLDALVTEQN
jgi:protein-disulfide isomerase